MKDRRDKNWDLIQDLLAAESSGKSPRLFSSRKTLFGIPSALDEELAALSQESASCQAASSPTAVAAPVAGGPSDAADATDHEGEAAHTSTPRRNARRMANAKTKEPAKAHTVTHPLKPVFDAHSKVLILGTMPSPRSRETGFYYNHPQNRFWKVMAAIFNEDIPTTNEEKESLVLRHNVALWDVLAQCSIEGASDGSIAACVPNNLDVILSHAPIEAIFCTGAKATELYRKYCEPETNIACTRLSSTSPANAATSLEQLIEEYRQILDWI